MAKVCSDPRVTAARSAITQPIPDEALHDVPSDQHADFSGSHKLLAYAKALSLELDAPITPGLEVLVLKASRGIEDIPELTYIRRTAAGSPPYCPSRRCAMHRTPFIGYPLLGTANTARKQAEDALLNEGALQSAIFNSVNFSRIVAAA